MRSPINTKNQLPDEGERELLKLFCARAEAVATSPIYSENRLSVGLSIKWEKGGPIATKHHGPDNAELLTLVTIIRQLIADSEQINFRRVYNIVYRRLAASKHPDEASISNAKSAMSGYKTIMATLPIKIHLDKKPLSPSGIIDIWFNGNIFHADPEKAKVFDALWSTPGGNVVDFCFRSVMTQLATLIVYFGGFIRSVVLKEDLGKLSGNSIKLVKSSGSVE